MAAQVWHALLVAITHAWPLLLLTGVPAVNLGAPPAGRRVVLVDDLDAAWSLAEQWDALAEECDSSPMMRPAYALTWFEHLGRGRLLLVAVIDDDRLVALAPLHERRLGPLRLVRWLGHGLGTVGSALVVPGRPELARLLWRGVRSPWRVLQLVETRADGQGYDALLARSVRVRQRDTCPTLRLRASHAAHLARPGRKSMRRSVATGHRRLAESGVTSRVVIAETPADLAALLPDVRAVWDASEAARPRQHFFSGDLEAFTLDLLDRAMARGGASVLVGYDGDRPAAADVWLHGESTALGLLARFHPDHARSRPGHRLLAAGYDHAVARGARTLDLGVGDSEYKRGWADDGYRTVDVLAGSGLLLVVGEPLLRWCEARHTRAGRDDGEAAPAALVRERATTPGRL